MWCMVASAGGSFDTPADSFYHLLLLQTTLSVFGVELRQYYTVSNLTAIYYVLFIVVSHLFLTKMVIAVGYNSYRGYMRAKIAKHIATRNQALSVAYRLLTNGEGVTMDTWLRLCKKLKRPDELVMMDGWMDGWMDG